LAIKISTSSRVVASPPTTTTGSRGATLARAYTV
jgi:hypothetical protein